MPPLPLAHEWLLREVLSFMEQDEDGAYCLWLVAVETGSTSLQTALELLHVIDDAPLSMARARLLAMVYGSWTALHHLSKDEAKPQLGRYAVGHILHELGQRRKPLRHHPHREIAMRMTAAPRSVPAFVMYVAAQRGQLESVVYLHHVAQYDPPEALDAAASAGHADVVSWLLDNAHTAKWVTGGCSVVPSYQYRHEPKIGIMAWYVRGTAFAGSYVMTEKWGYDWCADSTTLLYPVMDLAAQHGDLDSLKRLATHAVFSRAFSAMAPENAAAAGHLSTVRWLYDQYPKAFQHSHTMHHALVAGHLDVAQCMYFLIDGLWEIKTSTFPEVAKRGHLHVLQWMMDMFRELVPSGLLKLAAGKGHAHIVKWLMSEKGYTVGFDTVHAAISSGNLAFAKSLLSQCTRRVNGALLNSAVQTGNTAMARWVVEELKLWSPDALRFATDCATTEMAEYIHSLAIDRVHRLGSSLSQEAPVKSSGWFMNGRFDTFEWLLRHGYCHSLFENETHFKMIDYADQWYAKKYASLGWEDEDIRDSCWPKSPSAIRRLRDVVELFIDVYDARFVCSIPWFPGWAVRNRRFKSLRRLADINHPQLRTARFARLLLRKSRDEAMVQWFVETYPSLFTTHVVRWAIEHEKRKLLVWVFETFLPATTAENVDKTTLQKRCLQTAAWFATKHNRPEIFQLLPRWTTELDKPWRWRGIFNRGPSQAYGDVAMSDD